MKTTVCSSVIIPALAFRRSGSGLFLLRAVAYGFSVSSMRLSRCRASVNRRSDSARFTVDRACDCLSSFSYCSYSLSFSDFLRKSPNMVKRVFSDAFMLKCSESKRVWGSVVQRDLTIACRPVQGTPCNREEV